MTSTLTYNGLISIMQDIATRHYMIDTFLVGRNSEIGESAAVVYPMLQVYPTTARMPINEQGFFKTIEIEISVKVIDQLQPAKENENDIVSDTLQTLQDIINELNTHPYYVNKRVRIIGDIDFEELDEFEDDFTSGWECNLTFQFINHNTYCGLPIGSIPGYEAISNDCPTVLVKNSDGTYITTVNAGNTLNLSDVTITTADGSLTNPSAVNINLSAYTSGTSMTTIGYSRPTISQTFSSYTNWDEAYLYQNSVDTYTAGTNAAIAIVQHGNPCKLQANNVWGHKFRFTGLYGGYYNEDDSTYYDSAGTASNYATEFEQTTNEPYVVDHHTGLGWLASGTTADYWSGVQLSIESYQTGSGSTLCGLSDWYAPTRSQITSLFRWDALEHSWTNDFWGAAPPFKFDVTDQPWSCTNLYATSPHLFNLYLSSAALGSFNSRNRSNSTSAKWFVRYHFTSDQTPY